VLEVLVLDTCICTDFESLHGVVHVLGHLEISVPETRVNYEVEHVDGRRSDVVTFELADHLGELVQSEVLFLRVLGFEGPTPNHDPAEEHKDSFFAVLAMNDDLSAFRFELFRFLFVQVLLYVIHRNNLAIQQNTGIECREQLIFDADFIVY